MATYQLACSIGTTNADANLGVEVWLDDQQLYNNDHVVEEHNLSWELDEGVNSAHELRFVMKNKSSSDTTIDENGNIVKDSVITIKNVEFDGIKLNQVFVDLSVYTHNFNSTKETTTEKFYGDMGCNGTVSLKFTTPIYLWLLENM